MRTTIVAGETFSYIEPAAGYPAGDGWTLSLIMSPRAGGTVITVNSTTEDGAHLLTAAATTTAGWAAGEYAWEIWALLGTEKYRVDAGQLRLVPSLLTGAAGLDTRTQAEIALADARAAFAGYSPTTKFYMIAGRQMAFASPAEIIAVISHWSGEVKREQAAAAMASGRPNPRKLQVRMGRA